MTFRNILNNPRGWWANKALRLRGWALARPLATVCLLVGSGLAVGLGAGTGLALATAADLRAELQGQDQRLDQVREAAQLEINALAARLGELQAQATRLNALGDRLTQVGQLEDGEFDFNRPVGMGGAERSQDMPLSELVDGLDRLERQYAQADGQLGVLEALLFDRALDRNAVPSRAPVRNSYITSGFGYRADPFGRGRQLHKGIDFDANVGDPVLAVADGVVSFSDTRSGYGKTVEVDHGNGYVTRYAHNSRLSVRVGDLVRVGPEVAKAGSTGRSTGAHVHFEVWENGRVVNPRKFLAQATPVGKRSRG